MDLTVKWIDGNAEDVRYEVWLYRAKVTPKAVPFRGSYKDKDEAERIAGIEKQNHPKAKVIVRTVKFSRTILEEHESL